MGILSDGLIDISYSSVGLFLFGSYSFVVSGLLVSEVMWLECHLWVSQIAAGSRGKILPRVSRK